MGMATPAAPRNNKLGQNTNRGRGERILVSPCPEDSAESNQKRAGISKLNPAINVNRSLFILKASPWLHRGLTPSNELLRVRHVFGVDERVELIAGQKSQLYSGFAQADVFVVRSVRHFRRIVVADFGR